eukprot:GFYU01016879.1.p1 GENE.GFYU01016879.1~~GFYU01016879.1.p1  ORF type:complete len:611 (+),score=113.17 GFYU01016879.1:98-1930(+)
MKKSESFMKPLLSGDMETSDGPPVQSHSHSPQSQSQSPQHGGSGSPGQGVSGVTRNRQTPGESSPSRNTNTTPTASHPASPYASGKRDDISYQAAIDAFKQERAATSLPRPFSTPDLQAAEVTASQYYGMGAFRREYVQRTAWGAFIEGLKVIGNPNLRMDITGLPEDEDDDIGSNASQFQHDGTKYTKLRREGSGTKEEKTGSTPAQTVATIFKSFIGPGILFLPKGFANAGIAFAIPGMVLCGLLATICMLKLVSSKVTLEMKTGKAVNGYGDIGLKTNGKLGQTLVNGSIFMSQFGFCGAYYIFVAKNLHNVLLFASDCAVNVDKQYLILAMLPIVIPLCWIRKLGKLAATNILADLFILFGLLYIYVYDVLQVSPERWQTVKYFNSEHFGVFIGTAVYTFEGIALVLPIQEAMEDKRQLPSILSWSMLGITALLTSFAALGYCAFGDSIESPVTLNLRTDYTIVYFVQVLYCMAVIFTYPLMKFPAFRILETEFPALVFHSKLPVRRWKKNIFRATVCMLCATVSILGLDQLDNFVSIIGSLCCVPLAFVYPALFHLKAHPTQSTAQRLGNYGLIAFGGVAMVFSAVMAVYSWVNAEPEIEKPCIA